MVRPRSLTAGCKWATVTANELPENAANDIQIRNSNPGLEACEPKNNSDGRVAICGFVIEACTSSMLCVTNATPPI